MVHLKNFITNTMNLECTTSNKKHGSYNGPNMFKMYHLKEKEKNHHGVP